MTTINDVSKIAGVSVATVSRTLSLPEKVSPKTRQKVFEAIKQTNYKPDVLARNFRTRKTSTIVVLVPDIANPFFSRVIRGIEKTAQKKGYSVLLGDTQGIPELEDNYANMLKTSQVDGLIQLNARLPFSNKEDLSLPIVNLCDCLKETDIVTVQLDNVSAAQTLTEHFISMGHINIGLIIGPKKSIVTQDRLEGFKNAMNKAGLHVYTDNIIEGDFSLKSGESSARKLLSSKNPPTAFFCFNDEMAIGAIHHIKSAGLNVPKDISVAGFDDINFAQYCDPPLTTISQPAENFGEVAMTLLYDIIHKNHIECTKHYLPFTFIRRQSTATVPA